MKAFPALCLFALLGAGSLYAASSAWIQEGDDDFYNLDYDRSIAAYEKAVAANPDDASYHNHLAQALLYREMYRDGTLESELVSGNNSFLRRAKLEPSAEVEQRFFSEIGRSMHLAQARIAKNSRDTVALHQLSIAFALRANYEFLVRKSWRASLFDASQARKYDTEVTQIDSTNYDARLVPAIYEYIAGSMNWTMRAIGFVAGFHGDKQHSIRTIEEIAEKGNDNRVDAQIILCALYRREGQPARAIPLVTSLIQRYPRAYLLHFELAQMYAATGDRKSALASLGEVARLKQDDAAGYARIPWEKIYYETGNLEFWFNDLDHALQHLKKVTSSPQRLQELDLNTGVLALMREGQIYDLQKHHSLAVEAYREAARFAPQAEAAHESQHYINSPYTRPNHSLDRG